MIRKRLSREESRELTRQRLLEAAAKVIAKVGYASAAMEEIAETAGYSRGAFYSNFGSKDELFLVLLQQMAETKFATVQQAFTAGGTSDELLERLRALYVSLYQDRAHFLIWFEAKMHATRAPEFRKGFNVLEREMRTQMAVYVGRFYTQAGCQPPAPPEEIALGLMALADGMMLMQIIDPKAVPDAVLESVMRRFFTSVAG